MKKIGHALVAALLLIEISGHSQIPNKDEMIKKIFAAFKNKDEKDFIKLFPDATTIKAFMKKLMAADSSKEKNAMMNMLIDQMTDSSIQGDIKKSFKKFLKKGEDKGVDWSKITFVSYKSDSAMRDEDGIKAGHLTGTVYFNIGTKAYFFDFRDVIWFENQGWYGVEIERVDLKSNENQPGNVAAGSKPTTKPVQKQPVKTKPAAGKTQTTARKPR
jgi:hypothetical protein